LRRVATYPDLADRFQQGKIDVALRDRALSLLAERLTRGARAVYG